MVDWHEAGRKAARTRKRRAAGRKAATTRKRRTAATKAARTRKRKVAGRKAAATRKRNAEGKTTDKEGGPVRALTIRQPWPELILRGRKPFELRSWRTKYRGPLVIHSAARVDSQSATVLGLNPDTLTSGAFVGVALLTDVRPYTRSDSRLLNKRKGNVGGWSPGLFAWVLKKPRRITPPIKAKGKLGLISVPRRVLRKIEN